jgi:hypothetical protein
MIAAASPRAGAVTPIASMRDGRTSHSQLFDDYSMRAQDFYTTGINALEDPASYF